MNSGIRQVQQIISGKIRDGLDTENASSFVRSVTDDTTGAVQVVWCLDVNSRHRPHWEASTGLNGKISGNFSITILAQRCR